MAKITIENLVKKYGDLVALDDVNLEIADKEFVVLFGPAGAGKTTLLSVISGIIDHDQGHIEFNGNNIGELSPNKRNVAMVFENYALYPHFTAFENIAFPLRSPEFKTSEEEIVKAIDDITKKMNINHLLNRLPSQMSNGQRQRVALGRALVRQPNVFLMDEPLAHLDAKLKNAMRTELKSIQQQLNTTTIYVTHDYLEALSLGDRIIVIHEGVIQQVGTPDEIYYEPNSTFVAKLVGEPEINIFPSKLSSSSVSIIGTNISWNLDKLVLKKLQEKTADGEILLGIRGVDIKVSFEKNAAFPISGNIIDLHSIGNRFVINVQCDGFIVNALVPGSSVLSVGQNVYFKFDEEMFVFFEKTSETFITKNYVTGAE